MSTTLSPKIVDYLKAVSDKSSELKLDGYYPIDVVIDAHVAGEEHGKSATFEKVKEMLVRTSAEMFLSGTKVATLMHKSGYSYYAIYVNPFEFKFIFAVDENNTYNEDFIEFFYSTCEKQENLFFESNKMPMNISFIANECINEKELQVDGFIKLENFA